MSEDKERFEEKAVIAFRRLGGVDGEPKEIGDFRIEHVDEIGTWVYKRGHGLIFAMNYSNRHADYTEDDEILRARDDFLRYLILEELADV